MPFHKLVARRLPEATYETLLRMKQVDGYREKGWGEWLTYKSREWSRTPTDSQRRREETGEGLMQMWLMNFADNLQDIREGLTLRDLLPKDNPLRPAIVVGRGPSFFKHQHAKLLAEYRDKVTIVSTDGSSSELLRNGCVPDYVLTVDGSEKVVPFYSTPEWTKFGPKIKVILVISTNHQVYEKCVENGSKVYWTMSLWDDYRLADSLVRWMTMMCFDIETRVVVKGRGLVHFKDVRVGDTVFSMNPTTRALELDEVDDKFVYKYAGPMFQYTGTRMNLCVTPTHRMLIRSRSPHGNHVLFEPAYKTAKRAIWEAPCSTHFESQNKFPYRIPPNVQPQDVLYLIGIFIGDGWQSRADDYHNILLFIPRSDKARTKVEKCLYRCGCQFSPHDSNIYLHTGTSNWLFKIFQNCGYGALAKHIPSEILNLPSSLLEFLLSGIADSDGHYAYAVGQKPRKPAPYISITTSSPQLKDDLVELAVKTGRWPRTTIQRKGGNRWVVGRWVTAHTHFRVLLSKSPKVLRRTNAQVKPYKGHVWCVSVRKNQNLLVERNGHFVFSGNCINRKRQDSVSTLRVGTNAGEGCFSLAYAILKHHEICLTGIDMGYPAGFPLEQTAYYQSAKNSGVDMLHFSTVFTNFTHPILGSSYADPVFVQYRNGFRDMVSELHGVRVINGTGGGTLFGDGIEVLNLKEWLDIL